MLIQNFVKKNIQNKEIKTTCNASSFERVAWKSASSNSGPSGSKFGEPWNSLSTSMGSTGSRPYNILKGENLVEAWTVDLSQKRKINKNNNNNNNKLITIIINKIEQ